MVTKKSSPNYPSDNNNIGRSGCGMKMMKLCKNIIKLSTVEIYLTWATKNRQDLFVFVNFVLERLCGNKMDMKYL